MTFARDKLVLFQRYCRPSLAKMDSAKSYTRKGFDVVYHFSGDMNNDILFGLLNRKLV